MDNKPKRGRKPNPEGTKAQYGETVSIRLDSRLRYLLELAGRRQHRSLTGMVEWLIEDSLQRITLGSTPDSNTLAKEINRLWDAEESDRIMMLALHYRDLLTAEEHTLWKLVRDNPEFWNVEMTPSGKRYTQLIEDNLYFEKVRAKWPELKKTAGERPGSKGQSEED